MLTEAQQHNQLQCLHETNSSKQSQPVETADETCRVACSERYRAAIIVTINPPQRLRPLARPVSRGVAEKHSTVWATHKKILNLIYEPGQTRRGTVGSLAAPGPTPQICPDLSLTLLIASRPPPTPACILPIAGAARISREAAAAAAARSASPSGVVRV